MMESPRRFWEAKPVLRREPERGFPAVADESVALAARVVALSDRYEAMTAERPYRALLSAAQVWSILDEVVGEPMARTALRALRRAVVETQ